MGHARRKKQARRERKAVEVGILGDVAESVRKILWTKNGRLPELPAPEPRAGSDGTAVPDTSASTLPVKIPDAVLDPVRPNADAPEGYGGEFWKHLTVFLHLVPVSPFEAQPEEEPGSKSQSQVPLQFPPQGEQAQLKKLRPKNLQELRQMALKMAEFERKVLENAEAFKGGQIPIPFPEQKQEGMEFSDARNLYISLRGNGYFSLDLVVEGAYAVPQVVSFPEVLEAPGDKPVRYGYFIQPFNLVPKAPKNYDRRNFRIRTAKYLMDPRGVPSMEVIYDEI